ncbi:Aldehyde/histidinol dehydrogenase [Lentinula lateritia]|uniref:Aldehyde/histidinol dehydrogenase n=1 Tax=Lentinula aff. lateritia TaxID=2804960 RepID=A0ACC1TZW4_9AGAR|nr:Aldehyde/histidinol dehydrogenase [Lentinula aff. lateritia]KAJ3856725.1 Aldehyde/histidinol dehydrogenase [Lentinula lateritia]
MPFPATNSRNAGKTSFNTGLYINGKFVEGSDKNTINVINPATGKIIRKVVEATFKDVDVAVAAAHKAFKTTWGLNMGGAGRSRLLAKLAQFMEEHQLELTALEALDSGKSFTWVMDVDTTFAIDTNGGGSSLRPHVRVQIALAPGNRIVMKPSESTPLPAIHMSKLIHDARFPPRTFNFLTGYGDIVGAAISSHMKIDKVAFTGSTLVGRKIMEVTAKSNLKDITLEFGGKSRNITFNDADVDQVVSWAAHGI